MVNVLLVSPESHETGAAALPPATDRGREACEADLAPPRRAVHIAAARPRLLQPDRDDNLSFLRGYVQKLS
jgi:hypothetical protein